MIDLRLLKSFLTVARLQNITKAAEELNYSQPTVTAQIRALEELYSVLLFERDGKKVVITEAGHKLVDYCEQILAKYEESYDALSSFRIKNAALTLGVSTHSINYLLPPILRKYYELVPEGNVCVNFYMHNSDVIKDILINQCDIGLLHDMVPNDKLVVSKITKQDLIWVATADLITKMNTKEWHEYPIINFTSSTTFRHLFDDYFSSYNIKSLLEYSDSEAVKQAVLDGLGAALLPIGIVRKEIENGTLVQLTSAPSKHFDIYVAFKKNVVLSPPMRRFLMILSELPYADKDFKNLLLI